LTQERLLEQVLRVLRTLDGLAAAQPDMSDLRHFSPHDFLIFILLLICIAGIGSVVLVRCARMLSMSREEERMEFKGDDVELRNLLSERQWTRDVESRILLPSGV